MFHWFRKFFTGNQLSTPVFDRRLVHDDARYIADALDSLGKIGFKFSPNVEENLEGISSGIAAHWEGISFGREPDRGNWVHIALAGDPRPFQNALHLDDHCYDGATPSDYLQIVTEIIALAGDEWSVQNIEVKGQPSEPNDQGQRLLVRIKATPETPPFELTTEKDFDWSIIFRLNERLPKEVQKRFAIFLDGDATIVFLTPGQIEELNSLCGYEFFYVDEFKGETMSDS